MDEIPLNSGMARDIMIYTINAMLYMRRNFAMNKRGKPNKTKGREYFVSAIEKKKKNERIAIKLKLIMSHVLLAAIPVIIVAVMLFLNAKTNIIQEVETANQATAEQVAYLIEAKMDEIETTSVTLIANQDILSTISKDIDDYDNSLEFMQERKNKLYSVTTPLEAHPNINSISFLTEKEILSGNVALYMTDGFLESFLGSQEYQLVVEADAKPLWFYGLFEQESLFFMRYVKNLSKSANNSVMLIEVKKDLIGNLLHAESLEEGARMTVVDAEGLVIESSDETAMMGQTLDITEELQQKIEVSTSEDRIISFVTKKNVSEETLVVASEMDNGWRYITKVPTSSIYGGINNMMSATLLVVVICFVIALLIGVYLAVIISNPINYIRGKMKAVEQGDLTVRSQFSGSRELGSLSDSFNAMTENMSVLIRDTKGITEQVAEDSVELQQIAKQSATYSKEVISAVESLAEGASDQALDADKTAEIIKELVTQINLTENSFQEVVQVTTKTKRASENASQSIEKLNTSTAKTMALTTNIKTDMGALTNRFKEILGIIDMINAISEQTNLLALNAAIEAARAGDAGKGFAVVADEVRKLASQSSEAAQDISSIVNSIYEMTKKTEEMIESGAEIYQQQEESVKDTEVTFNDIIRDMDNIIHEVDKVYVLLSGLDEIQNEATDSITSIAAISEESASAIQQVLATGNEQAEAAEHLSIMADKLNHVIEGMNEKITSFRID
jgi:methyl-accepting chemotaxis protein